MISPTNSITVFFEGIPFQFRVGYFVSPLTGRRRGEGADPARRRVVPLCKKQV